MQSYAIHDVPLLPQSKNMACWYACAQMLIAWRRSRTLSCESAHPDPSDVPALEKEFIRNDGLPFGKIANLAQKLGLVEVPPQTPSPGFVASMLKAFGPLWFAGLVPSGHVMVITGVSDRSVSFNDPWPVDKGQRSTLKFDDFGKFIQPLEVSRELIVPGYPLFGLTQAKLSSNLLHFPG